MKSLNKSADTLTAVRHLRDQAIDECAADAAAWAAVHGMALDCYLNRLALIEAALEPAEVASARAA